MVIRKREFFTGLVLLVSFFVVLAVLMSPVMNGKTVIAYTDDLFNQLTKGSTYHIPSVLNQAGNFEGISFQVTVEPKDEEDTVKITRLLTVAGATVEPGGEKLKVSGDLGRVAKAALADADAEFKNNGEQIKKRYGMESREAIYYWWNFFKSLHKEYKIEARSAEMSFVDSVMTKALEPAYNFEGIAAAKVADKAGVTTFMLAFYVIYTVWYGFAMMLIFEGLGISASASGKKTEA